MFVFLIMPHPHPPPLEYFILLFAFSKHLHTVISTLFIEFLDILIMKVSYMCICASFHK